MRNYDYYKSCFTYFVKEQKCCCVLPSRSYFICTITVSPTNITGFLANTPAVAFTAVVSAPSVTLGQGQTIVFDGVVMDIGNAYRGTMGIFRAPVKGVYVFSFAIMMDPGSSEHTILVRNNQDILWRGARVYPQDFHKSDSDS